jgi:hypothetical protein
MAVNDESVRMWKELVVAFNYTGMKMCQNFWFSNRI